MIGIRLAVIERALIMKKLPQYIMPKKSYKMSKQKKATLKAYVENPSKPLSHAVKQGYNCKNKDSHNSIAWHLRHDKSFKELLEQIDFDPQIPLNKILKAVETLDITEIEQIGLARICG